MIRNCELLWTFVVGLSLFLPKSKYAELVFWSDLNASFFQVLRLVYAKHQWLIWASTHFYRPQGKVMFSHAFVILSTSGHMPTQSLLILVGHSVTCYGVVGMHPTGMLSCYCLQWSCGKVMFLHLCVILFTVGEGGHCQEDPPDKEPPDRDPFGHKSPWTETPQTKTPQTENPPGRKAPGQRPPRTENPLDRFPPDRDPPRTLLECILVIRVILLVSWQHWRWNSV